MKRYVIVLIVAAVGVASVWGGVKFGYRAVRRLARGAQPAAAPASPGDIEGEDPTTLAVVPPRNHGVIEVEPGAGEPVQNVAFLQQDETSRAVQPETEPAGTRYLHLLEQGLEQLLAHRDYSATFYREERVNGEMLDPTTSVLKVRHQPFSIHMSWDANRREAAYVEGQNRNKLLVRDDNLPRALSRMQIDPGGYIAMAESRYPVTKVGLAPLTQTLIGYRRRDLGLAVGVTCRALADAKFDGRDCYGFVVEYANAGVEPVYRKSVVYLDREFPVPVCVKNYGWPDATHSGPPGEENTLVEYYTYRDLKFDVGLGDGDFTIRPRTSNTSEAGGK